MLRHAVKQLKILRHLKPFSAATFVKSCAAYPFDRYFRNGRSSQPLVLGFYVTRRCNSRCTMCSVGDFLTDDKESDTPIALINRLLEQVKSFKPHVVLFGGEPFIREDIIEIISLVKRHGMTCGTFTNGSLIGKETADELIRLGMEYIIFSIHGGREVHDRVARNSGAYDAAIWALGYISEKGKGRTAVGINSVLTAENLDSLEHTAELGVKNGISLVRFEHLTFLTPEEFSRSLDFFSRRMQGEEVKPLNLIYSPDGVAGEIVKAVSIVKKKFGKAVSIIPDLSEAETRNWYSNDFRLWKKCPFIWRGVGMLPDGGVIPCDAHYIVFGNINRENLLDIWNNEKYMRFRRLFSSETVPSCARCPRAVG